MNENNLGGQVEADLAQLQNMSRNDGAEVAHPQGNLDVSEMTDEQFLEYIDRARDGSTEENNIVQEEAPSGAENASGGNEPEPFMVFNSQEDYQNHFNERLDKRFKNVKQNRELEEVLQVARGLYDTDDDGALLRRVKQDMLNAAAASEGKAPEELQGEIELKQKAAAFDKMREAEDGKNRIVEKWNEESERLKQQIPEFDLEKALENPDFYKGIVSGKSVAESYISAFLGNKKQSPIRTITQNAASTTGPSSARRDPSQLSDEDFMKYIKKITEI